MRKAPANQEMMRNAAEVDPFTNTATARQALNNDISATFVRRRAYKLHQENKNKMIGIVKLDFNLQESTSTMEWTSGADLYLLNGKTFNSVSPGEEYCWKRNETRFSQENYI